MTNIYTHDTDEFIYNIEQMTNDEIKLTFDIIYDLYHKYDEPENLNRVAEHFRQQIDIIENYVNHVRGFTMFDKTE